MGDPRALSNGVPTAAELVGAAASVPCGPGRLRHAQRASEGAAGFQ
jgi:hypothetical protein